jgi:hypothetical protein
VPAAAGEGHASTGAPRAKRKTDPRQELSANSTRRVLLSVSMIILLATVTGCEDNYFEDQVRRNIFEFLKYSKTTSNAVAVKIASDLEIRYISKGEQKFFIQKASNYHGGMFMSTFMKNAIEKRQNHFMVLEESPNVSNIGQRYS